MRLQILKFLLLGIIAVGGCIADLATKDLALDRLKDRSTFIVVDGFLEFSYVENRGMVFGILNHGPSGTKHIILSLVNCISILFVFYLIRRIRSLSFLFHLPFFLILAGAFGNLIDRFRFGHVVDFIHIYWKHYLDWPYLFNIADALVVVGAGFLMILSVFRRKELEGSLF